MERLLLERSGPGGLVLTEKMLMGESKRLDRRTIFYAKLVSSSLHAERRSMERGGGGGGRESWFTVRRCAKPYILGSEEWAGKLRRRMALEHVF